MAELVPIEVLCAQPPAEAGLCRLAILPPIRKTWLAPWPGEEHAFSATLHAALGLSFPAPGQVVRSDTATVFWAGREAAFLVGAAPPDALGEQGAVVDVSDGWVRLQLEGDDAPSVLSRLCPVDLRSHLFASETALRTQMGHTNALVMAGRADGIELWGARSYAAHLHDQLAEAMRVVAARRDLRG